MMLLFEHNITEHVTESSSGATVFYVRRVPPESAYSRRIPKLGE